MSPWLLARLRKIPPSIDVKVVTWLLVSASVIVRPPVARHLELKCLSLQVDMLPLSEACRLEGLTWASSITLGATFFVCHE